VFEGQRFDAVAKVVVADLAGKRHYRAVFIALGQPGVFVADLKAVMADYNTRLRHVIPR